MRDALSGAAKRTANPGLVLDKYVRGCGAGDEAAKEEAVSEASSGCGRLSQAYKAAFDRWKRAIEATQIPSAMFRVDGRLLVGIGESVAEMGVRLHHTYGTPTIPGSALKGLASHYCNRVWGEEDQRYRLKGEYHRLMFGETDESGLLVFHDAWIDSSSVPSCIIPDITTVHQVDYYRKEGKDAPHGMYSPIPVRTVSVKGRFLIAVGENSGTGEGRKWAELGLELLTQALSISGVGGKTSSGYGRLKRETS